MGGPQGGYGQQWGGYDQYGWGPQGGYGDYNQGYGGYGGGGQSYGGYGAAAGGKTPRGGARSWGLQRPRGSGWTPTWRTPKRRTSQPHIRKLPINCHFLSSKKSVHKKYQKIAANYFYYRTTIFLRYQLLELQLQNSLDISICFPSLSPKQQKRYIKKHNHFFMDPKTNFHKTLLTWVSSKKKIFCL